jgi:RNA polymerase sigma-70 factor (ECF subfamily)
MTPNLALMEIGGGGGPVLSVIEELPAAGPGPAEDETALVLRAARGDQMAFARLIDVRLDGLYGTAYRILRDREVAADAVQEALYRGWRDVPSLRMPDHFDAWLMRVLLNVCMRAAKMSRRQPVPLDHDPIHLARASTEASVADRDALERAFRRLTPEQRAVVVLHHYLEYDSAEIATALRIPRGTVRSRLHYATRLLRAALDADSRPGLTGGDR